MIEFNKESFDTAFHAAAANWSAWREDYNWTGDWQNRPLLNCIDRFSRFCRDYSLARNIPGDPRLKSGSKCHSIAAKKRRVVVMDYLRNHSICSAPDQIDQYGEREFDEAVNRSTDTLPSLPVCLGEKKQSKRVASSISLFSKVACFAYPSDIPPFDTLNTRALNANGNYETFFKKFNNAHVKLWEDVKARRIELVTPSFIGEKYKNGSKLPEAFCWRITDNYLMLLGRPE